MEVCTIIAKNYAPQARVLARSLTAHHPDLELRVLVIDETEGYLDEAMEPFSIIGPHEIGLPDFERMAGIYDLLELSTAVKPWLLRTMLERDGEGAVYLDPDMRLYAPLDELFAAVLDHGLVLSPHNLGPMPRDGKRPNEQDILIAGAYNLGFIGLRAGATAEHLLDWWGERLETDCIVDPSRGFFVDQRWIDLVPGMVEDFHLLRDPGFNVAYWNLHAREISKADDGTWLAGGVPLRLAHFSGFDARRPERLSKHQNRIELGSHPALAELCDGYAAALIEDGALDTGDWPYTYGVTASGAPMNRTLRSLYREAVLDDDFSGSLYDAAGEREFIAHLNGPATTGGGRGVTRYLERLWQEREDLRAAYPRLDEAQDAAGFLGWARTFAVGEVPELLRPAEVTSGRAAPAPAAAEPEAETPFGVNVVGYLNAELGVGEVARQAIRALDHAGVPVIPVGVSAPHSRRTDGPAGVPPPSPAFPVDLLCVNADALPGLVAGLGSEFLAHHHTIGWWWWEVSTFPEQWHGAFDHVDEIWTGSAFVADALSAVAPVPVVRMPVPVALPGAPVADRAGLGLPSGPLLLFVFDHHSVFERKNPLGLIDAFLRAFPHAGEATLVVKTVNGDSHPDDRARLRRAIEPHEHVLLREESLSADDKNRLIASCDAYVSLHRSEGLGLTMAEAMVLGKPVIATGYSGNLDFMTPANSHLVRYEAVPVGPGADPYPADAVWAEPDLDHAAELMRAVVADPAGARALGARAAVDLQRTNGVAAAGAAMQSRLMQIAHHLPSGGHDFLWAAREHTASMGQLIGHPPAAAGGRRRNRLTGLARKAVLRAMKPQTTHQARIDEQVRVALSDLAQEVHQLRASTQRQLTSEAAVLRRMRQQELEQHSQTATGLAAVNARVDDVAGTALQADRRLRRHGLAVGPEDAAAPEAYPEAPAEPWSQAYNEAHRGFVARELEDEELLAALRSGGDLPAAFGRGFDERVVELPWLFSHDLRGRFLDAGSALNHFNVLSRVRPRVETLDIVTLAPEDDAYPQLDVRYDYADLRDLPYPDAAYDRIACVSTLEHVGLDNTRFGAGDADPVGEPQPELERAVRELWRVLAPGGELYVTVPVGAGDRLAWVRSLRTAEVDGIVAACHGAQRTVEWFRMNGGWQRVERDAVEDAGYRDGAGSSPVEGYVAAEAVACLRLAKPAG